MGTSRRLLLDRRSLALALCTILVPLAGCTSSHPQAGPLRAVDDAGDTVALARPARRIVSLIPATTELLFAIGAGDAVVGRTPWCDYPEAVSRIPSLGDGIAPNIEAILAQRPDLVLLYRSAGNDAAVLRLRGLGVPVFQALTDRVADVPRLARTLGRLTGHERAADSLDHAFARELEAATQPSDATGPSIFLLAWEQPPMTVGAGSFLTELAERAGGRNVFADLPASAAQISIEAVVARDPDVILTTAGAGTPGFAERPEWQSVRAVRERRFVSIAGSEFSRPSPRLPAAIRALTARLDRAAAATP